MKKILILNGQYAPGYKGGGPIQSCINLVENMCDRYEFYVLCADRDCLCCKPYDNVPINEWTYVGHARVYYMSSDKQRFCEFAKLINSVYADVIYLNGFFSPIYTIRPLILRRLHRINANKFIITPRGDFTGGCENKRLKKYTYIYISKVLGLYKNLLWQATSEIEESDILAKFQFAQTIIVPNLTKKYVEKPIVIDKKPGELRLVFVSRIFPKKNLKYGIEALKGIVGTEIRLDIYGPLHDPEYWKECEAVIKELPQNIYVDYKGEVEHNDIPNIYQQYHAFLFPTLGENYGHVIVEAMMNNCLCILSKGTTPWDDYSECGELVCDLEYMEEFTHSIQWLVDMDNEEFVSIVAKNNAYIANKVDCENIKQAYINMLG